MDVNEGGGGQVRPGIGGLHGLGLVEGEGVGSNVGVGGDVGYGGCEPRLEGIVQCTKGGGGVRVDVNEELKFL